MSWNDFKCALPKRARHALAVFNVNGPEALAELDMERLRGKRNFGAKSMVDLIVCARDHGVPLHPSLDAALPPKMVQPHESPDVTVVQAMEDLRKAVRGVDAAVKAQLKRRPRIEVVHDLSRRQMEIVVRLLGGMSAAEIAAADGITEQRVSQIKYEACERLKLVLGKEE